MLLQQGLNLFFDKIWSRYQTYDAINPYNEEFINKLIMGADLNLNDDNHPYRVNFSSSHDDVALAGIILSAHKSYYEDYQYLMLYLSFLIKKDHDVGPKMTALNQAIDNVRGQDTADIAQVLSTWESKNLVVQKNDAIKSLILSCYRYHLCLENVYFTSLKAVHDPAAEKLFSQGLALYALMGLYYPGQYRELPGAMQKEFRRQPGSSILNPIRIQTQTWNLPRLFLNRLRRLILSINALDISPYLQMLVQHNDPGIQFALGWLNLVFFIPRLLSQIGPWIKHLVVYDHKDNIDFSMRFWGQLHRRWDEVLRDLLWLSNAVLSLFVFTGGFIILGLYAVVVAQFVEVCLNAYFLGQQTNRLQATRLFFKDKLGADDEFLGQFKADMNLKVKGAQQRLLVSSLFLLSSILILPCIAALSVYLPLIGSVLAAIITLYLLYDVYVVSKKAPTPQLTAPKTFEPSAND